MIKTDQAAQVDTLDRESLAGYITNSIAHTAKHETNGFVVAITGKWGSGKSTLLGFVQEKLKVSFTNEEACFLEFNPWALSEASDLRKAFLKQFIYGIAPKAHRKSWLKKSFKAVIELLKNITLGFQKVPGVSLDLNSLLTQYLDTDNTTYYKKLIDEKLEKSNRKIFVFIDDIDRLAPGQIFSIFQLLKLTGNFKNTYYILAFDREAVEISIESQFSNYGQKFLDKIIQADFGMPEINDEKVEQLFFDQLEVLAAQLKIPFNRSELSSLWLHHGLKNYFRTIREINRLISSLHFSLPPIANEINLCDFLVLETLRLNKYSVYEHIFNEGGWSVKNYSGMHPHSFSTSAEERMTKPLLDFLFDGYARDNENAKRLRDPKFFDRYFTLRIGEKDVSEKELQMLFENPNTEEVLSNTLAFGRLGNMLLRLNDSDILKHYANWNISLVEKLYDFFHKRYKELSQDENAYADAIINMISVREQDQYTNFNHFLQYLFQQKSMYSGAKVHFLHFMCLDKYHNTGFSANSYAFKEFYLQRHVEIEKEYVEYLDKWNSYITANELTDPESTSTFLFLYDYAYYFKEDYQNSVVRFLKNDSYLQFYLRKILLINDRDDLPFRVKTDIMNRFLPGPLLNDFAHALGRMDPKRLSGKQLQWRDYFLEFAFKYLANNGLLAPEN
jgi:hypothetical protein